MKNFLKSYQSYNLINAGVAIIKYGSIMTQRGDENDTFFIVTVG